MTGHSWYDDVHVLMDDEPKITEFNYEDFIHPALLNKEFVGTPEFKKMIKVMNL